MTTVELIVAATSLIAVIVSLITANSASRRSAFEDLKKVVDEVKEQLRKEQAAREKLQMELNYERSRRIRIENWAYQLSRQLEDNHIKPIPFPVEAPNEKTF